MRRVLVALGGLALLTGLPPLAGPTRAGDAFPLEPGFRSLFNGKTLDGWTYKGSKESLAGKTTTPDGRIQVAAGAIVMMPKDREGKTGIRDLYTIESFNKPFHLKLQFRAGLKADSGVYVRGPQLQVSDFVRRRENPQPKQFKNDDWNDLDIVVRHGVPAVQFNNRVLGDRDDLKINYTRSKATATLNGKPIDFRSLRVLKSTVAAECRVNGEPLDTLIGLPPKGGIGLQAESGQFEFRRIRIKSF